MTRPGFEPRARDRDFKNGQTSRSSLCPAVADLLRIRGENKRLKFKDFMNEHGESYLENKASGNLFTKLLRKSIDSITEE